MMHSKALLLIAISTFSMSFVSAQGHEWFTDDCFTNDNDLEFSSMAPPLVDARLIYDEAVGRACSTIPGYVTDEQGVEWASCLQKDADRFGGEMHAVFTLQRVNNGYPKYPKPSNVDCESSFKYLFHHKACPRGGHQPWPSAEGFDWVFTYRLLVRAGKCPQGIDTFHRSSGQRPFRRGRRDTVPELESDDEVTALWNGELKQR